jgi:chromosome segregation ATPase
MPEYDYFKISTSAWPPFERSRSFSHHHHHQHQHPRHHIRSRCPDNCARVSTDEWNLSIERERSVRTTNETLTRENRTLKSDLRASHQENRRLKDCNRNLQDELDELKRHHSRDDNFRRRMAALKAEVDSKDHALHELQKEKNFADIRVRELSQTVTDQAREITQLEDDTALLGQAHKKDQRDLGARTQEVREAWSLIEDLRRQLRKCRDPLPFRRRYGFL